MMNWGSGQLQGYGVHVQPHQGVFDHAAVEPAGLGAVLSAGLQVPAPPPSGVEPRCEQGSAATRGVEDLGPRQLLGVRWVGRLHG